MTEYTIVGIPGWETLRLNNAERAECDRRISQLVRQAVPDHLPRDRATPFRKELQRHFARLVEEARMAGASLICLPTQKMGDIAVPASYTVAEWQDSQATLGPDSMFSQLQQGSEGNVSLAHVDGQPALREDCVEAADPAEDPLATMAGRRISYTILSPKHTHRWMVFTFVTVGDGGPDGELADLLVRLFDAQMTTLRWQP